MNNRLIKKKTKDVKLLLTDCDGTLTDGGMYYLNNGDELKKFNTRDGVAIKYLNISGVITGMITGEDVELNRRRADKLKMKIYLPGVSDKVAAVDKLLEKYKVTYDEIVYFGDDRNDIELLKRVGLAICPSDAVREVKKVCDYVCKAKGGEGVIREFFDKFMGERYGKN